MRDKRKCKHKLYSTKVHCNRTAFGHSSFTLVFRTVYIPYFHMPSLILLDLRQTFESGKDTQFPDELFAGDIVADVSTTNLNSNFLTCITSAKISQHRPSSLPHFLGKPIQHASVYSRRCASWGFYIPNVYKELRQSDATWFRLHRKEWGKTVFVLLYDGQYLSEDLYIYKSLFEKSPSQWHFERTFSVIYMFS